MDARLIAPLLFIACAATACREQDEPAPAPRPAPPQPFFAWTAPAFELAELITRRAAVAAALKAHGGGVLLVPARDGFSSGETFRQQDDFTWLVGLELPNSLLLLDDDGDATLYLPRDDRRFVNPARANDFPGRPLADDPDIARRCGLAVSPIDALDAAIATRVERDRPLFVDLGRRDEPPQTDYVFAWTAEQGLAFHLRQRFERADLRNAGPLLARLRMIKSPAEIERLRAAARVTADGIRDAAKCIRDGISERALEGELEAAFKRRGAQRLAFDSIIKSGPNSLWPWRILAAHYDRRNRSMRDGELVIFDVGCEFDLYSSDVGRTFPVSGRFTARQRELVEMVRTVADAVIASIRPGVTFRDLRETAYAAIPADEQRHMQTALFFGHHVGLAVGDPSLDDAALAAGMVFTVEPWYYNHAEAVAVFIEDELLVTADGAENLTAALPRTAAQLERMVGILR